MPQSINSNFDDLIEQFSKSEVLETIEVIPETGKTPEKCFYYGNVANYLERLSGDYIHTLGISLTKKSFLEEKDYFLHTDIYVIIRDVTEEEKKVFNKIEGFSQTGMPKEIHFYNQFYSLDGYIPDMLEAIYLRKSSDYRKYLRKRIYANLKTNNHEIIIGGHFDIKAIYQELSSTLFFSSNIKEKKLAQAVGRIKNAGQSEEREIKYEAHGFVKRDSNTNELGFYRTIRNNEPKLLYKLGK